MQLRRENYTQNFSGFSKVFYLAILSLHGFTNGGGLERVYGGNVLILSLIAEY